MPLLKLVISSYLDGNIASLYFSKIETFESIEINSGLSSNVPKLHESNNIFFAILSGFESHKF